MVLNATFHHCLNAAETNAFIVRIQGTSAAALILQHKNSCKNTTDSVFGFSWNAFGMEQEGVQSFSLSSGRRKEQQHCQNKSAWMLRIGAARRYQREGPVGVSNPPVPNSLTRYRLKVCFFNMRKNNPVNSWFSYKPLKPVQLYWGYFHVLKWYEPCGNIWCS